MLSSPSTVIRFSRVSIALRGIGFTLALSTAAAGSGLPMCVSLLAQAAAPCDMHAGHNRVVTHGHAAQFAALVTAASGQACHQDVSSLGCAAGSACPTAGPAAPAWAHVPLGARAASPSGILGPASTFISYLAPPLSPPPQA